MEKKTMRKQDSQRDHLRDLLTVFFKHRTSILTIFLVVVLTVTLLSFLLPPVYEAKSSVLVKYGREYLNRPEVGAGQPIMSLNQEEVINSEIQILTSPDLAGMVIEKLKIGNIYPDLVDDPPKRITPLDAAVARFEKKLEVEGVRKSSVIQITFRHENPQVAARVVNLLVELFKEKHLEVFSGPQSSFLQGQLAVYRQKLLESEKSMEEFKQKNRVYSLEEQRTLLLQQRTELHSALLNTRNTVDELQKKQSSLKVQTRQLAGDKSLYTQTDRDRILVEAKARLLALELNEQDLLRKYNENNRMVVDIRKQIQIVRNFLKEQEADIKRAVQTGNAVYQEAQKELVRTEADLSAQKAKLATLGGQLGQLDREIQKLDLREMDMQGLKRELATNEKNFQVYGEKMEEARIIDDLNRLKLANISVIQPAAIPVKPSSPKKLLNITLGIIFGMFSGIGFAIFAERNSQGLLTPESVEKRLNLAVLAAIPYKE